MNIMNVNGTHVYAVHEKMEVAYSTISGLLQTGKCISLQFHT